MKPWKAWLRLAPAAALLLLAMAQAQNYPNRPLRVIVPGAPGGSMDTVARGLGQRLGDAFGQTFVVDNRPSGGSQIALELMSTAAPDGHTLMMLSATTVIHPLLYASRFDIVRDFTPVSQVTAQGYVLVVHPSIPAKSVAELVQHLRGRAGQLNYASSGIGSPIHMTGELFQLATGTRMTHIPFKGVSAAYTDLISGRVELAFPTIISSGPHISAGRLRALAVTPAKRVPALPDVPTMAEAGVPGVVVVNWYGLIAPKGTPPALIERISVETAQAMRSPDMTKRMLAEGSEAAGTTPQQFATHLRAERDMWAKVIKQAGIRGQ